MSSPAHQLPLDGTDPQPTLRLEQHTFRVGEHQTQFFPGDAAPQFPGLTVERTDDGWQVQAGGEIGLFPGTVGGERCLITVIPKGAQSAQSPSHVPKIATGARTTAVSRFSELNCPSHQYGSSLT